MLRLTSIAAPSRLQVARSTPVAVRAYATQIPVPPNPAGEQKVPDVPKIELETTAAGDVIISQPTTATSSAVIPDVSYPEQDSFVSMDRIPSIPVVSPEVWAAATQAAAARPFKPTPSATITPVTPTGSNLRSGHALPAEPVIKTSPISPVAEPTTAPVPPPVGPKKSRFGRALFWLLLLGSTGYAGGIYYSLQNDNFSDFFAEHVPLAEDIITYIEEQEFKRRFPNAGRRVLPAPAAQTSGNVPSTFVPAGVAHGSDLTNTKGPHQAATKKAGEQHIQEAKVPEPIKPAEPVVPVAPRIEEKQPEPVVQQRRLLDLEPAPAAAPAPVVKAPEPVAAPAPVAAPEPVVAKSKPTPVDAFETGSLADPVVGSLAQAVNGVISAANEGDAVDALRPNLEAAKVELAALNSKLAELHKEAEAELERRLTEQGRQFAALAQEQQQQVRSAFEAQEMQWREQFEHERESLTKLYTERLNTELNTQAQLAEQKTRNELVEQSIEMQRRWIREIKARVEEERGGRLGRLEVLQTKVKQLEALSADSADFIEAGVRAQKLHVAVQAVKAAVETPRPRSFARELAALKEVAGNDEVVKAAISAIDPATYERGHASIAQLADRFQLVAGEVRKVSLLPENAGVAGHAASWLVSKFMLRKTGMPVGNDVESILARAETYLEEGSLEQAAREINQLKGWPKRLVSDWLEQARRHLEVKQAVEVIELQAVLESLNVA
ncbi:MICOS complex subunit mic60 [Saitoella coloradoensis]